MYCWYIKQVVIWEDPNNSLSVFENVTISLFHFMINVHFML